MNTEQLNNTAHSLYTVYEALPGDVQRAFLEELFEKRHKELDDFAFYLACKEAKDENQFLNEQESNAFIQKLSK